MGEHTHSVEVCLLDGTYGYAKIIVDGACRVLSLERTGRKPNLLARISEVRGPLGSMIGWLVSACSESEAWQSPPLLLHVEDNPMLTAVRLLATGVEHHQIERALLDIATTESRLQLI